MPVRFFNTKNKNAYCKQTLTNNHMQSAWKYWVRCKRPNDQTALSNNDPMNLAC